MQKHAAVAPALETVSPPESGPTVAPVMAVAVPAVAAPGVETARLMLLLVHKHIAAAPVHKTASPPEVGKTGACVIAVAGAADPGVVTAR